MALLYSIRPDASASRVLDGEAVVINLDTGVYFGLNRPATALWGVLETAPRTAASLTEGLADAHGHDPAEVATDVRFFLAGLDRDGLVEAAEGDDGDVAVVDTSGPYLAPIAERYEKLDELMLSGE